MKTEHIMYYVEGEDDQKIVNTLKLEFLSIKTGRVQVLNVVEQKITDARLMALCKGTTVVLVFDTDTGNVDTLNENIKILEKSPFVKQVVKIPQVHNLEDEIVRSTDIRNIKELLNSKTNNEFKSDIIKVTNLAKKLKEHKFDMEQFWSSKPEEPYQAIENESQYVKL